MSEFPTILDLVGHTPIIRLPNLQPAGGARLLAKLEYMNPGGSIKDRIGLPMILAAEEAGLLKPGGTIVEPTSGNTGLGLAMAAAHRGYKCVFIIPDKMSREKINTLRAVGAEVIVCPTNVEPDDPRSYYSVSRRLAEETPNAWKPDQYSNPANPAAHYATTGPEIYEALGEELDVLVAGIGTGGTVTGAGRYLKERLPELVIVGADPEGSIYSSADVRPYLVEGVGEDFWPETFDPTLVDRYITISDRDSFRMARRAAREEGILLGGSCGLALHAAIEVARELPPEKTVLVVLPDGGRPYLSKFFDDAWMIENKMMEREGDGPTVSEILREKATELPDVPAFVSVESGQKVGEAITLLQRYGISQMPVVRGGQTLDVGAVVGSVHDRELLGRLYRDRDAVHMPVSKVMGPPLGVVQAEATVSEVYGDLHDHAAVVIVDGTKPVGVLTQADLLEHLARRGAA